LHGIGENKKRHWIPAFAGMTSWFFRAEGTAFAGTTALFVRANDADFAAKTKQP